MKDAVRALKKRSREVFMPLLHLPGEAQMDFGEALVKMGGVLQKVHFLAMVLPHSDALFVMAFERECTETFWEGHMRAFEFFGGVPKRISYDNSPVCVAQIIGPRERELTAAVERGLVMRAHCRDAIAQFLVPTEPWEQTIFQLDGREHLRQVKVMTSDVRAYQGLLAGGAA